MAEEFNSIVVPVTQYFLKKLHVPFTKQTVKRALENNPYYPSLFSISKLLNQYNIENKAIEIDKVHLKELPLPFFAFLELDSGEKDFVSVNYISEKNIQYFDGREKFFSKQEFLSRWTGVVLLAQPNEKSQEKDYEKNKAAYDKTKFRNGLIIAGFSLLLLYSIRMFFKVVEFQLSPLLLLVFVMSGLATSVFLLIHEIDAENIFVKNICTGSRKASCSAVLNSKASRIFGISWSEIGFFYFSSIFLFLFSPGTPFDEKKSILTYIFLFSAAYIPFSIWYQLFVIKQWCRLCLIIQIILSVCLVWSVTVGTFQFILTLNGLLSFSIATILPVLVWYALKPVIINAQNSGKFSAAYKRLYSHPDVFKVVVAGELVAPDGWMDLGGIEKGNSAAENILLKICSPSCGHCNKAHKLFNELISSNSNIKVITLYDVYDETGIYKELERPVKHFLALKAIGKESNLINAMDYWYLTPERTYEELKRLHPVPEEILEQQTEKIKTMSEWCRKAEITYTPTVFLNGHRLPATFELTDLKYILS